MDSIILPPGNTPREPSNAPDSFIIEQLSYEILNLEQTVFSFSGLSGENFRLNTYERALAFSLSTRDSLPGTGSAITPVLFVGEQKIEDFQVLGEKEYKFLAYEYQNLPDQAPIALGWPEDAENRVISRFIYRREP